MWTDDINMFTADGECTCNDREILPLSVQMQLSKNKKNLQAFHCTFGVHIKFWAFSNKKMSLIAFERCTYWNA